MSGVRTAGAKHLNVGVGSEKFVPSLDGLFRVLRTRLLCPFRASPGISQRFCDGSRDGDRLDSGDTMTDLESLRSLQKRIREATGPDRELDFAICKAFGRAPQDAIWEVDENLPPELAKHCKRGWTTPAYVEHRREYARGIEAAFAKKCTDAERAANIKALDKEWDYKNAPPFGCVPNWTTDPDGLGPCVALKREVLPGCRWTKTASGRYRVWGNEPDYILEGSHPAIWSDSEPLANDCLTFLDAIFSAVIAKEEAKHTEKAG